MLNLKDFYELKSMSNFRELLCAVSEIKKIHVLINFYIWKFRFHVRK